jgi:hypothetical protein
MHTAEELEEATFAVVLDGRPAAVGDLLPGFDEHDRLGIVVDAPCGVVGASLWLLAGIFSFYELQRQKGEGFWIYPDFFAFHVGKPHGHHGALDIWPPHKEPVIAADATALLQAINDRGITRLAVPEGRGASLGDLEREALASARGRLRSAISYSPDGRTATGDVSIAGNGITDGYVEDILLAEQLIERMGDSPEAVVVAAHLDEVPRAERTRIATARRDLRVDRRTTERYRRLDVDEALALVVATTTRAAGAERHASLNSW